MKVADRLVTKGKEVGLREGKEAGLREGKDDERRRIIRAKLEKGQTLEQIAEVLELPLEQVKEIAEQI